MTEKLTSNQEDYLEAISIITASKGVVRVKDIAVHLGVTSASVNGAVKSLSESGYIHYKPYELLRLTSKGQEYARKIVDKHYILQQFMIKILAMEEKEAEESACYMEHAMSCMMMEKLLLLTDFFMKDSNAVLQKWELFVKQGDKEPSGKGEVM